MFLFNQVAKNCGIGFRDFDETYKKLKQFVIRFMKKGFVSIYILRFYLMAIHKRHPHKIAKN